jgi:chemotaxis protein CheY-P-specific phosphatase CheC
MDGLREVSNVAMGRAADLLARLLEVFVELPVPKVNFLESGELQMALLDAAGNDDVSALCQGFIGGGISGEALLLLHESSYADLAALLSHTGEVDDSAKVELLMDTASLLIGAFMNGLADQLDISFSISHPIVLGHHADISTMIARNAGVWNKVLAIELGFTIEHHNISAQLLLLFTENSMTSISTRIAYLSE